MNEMLPLLARQPIFNIQMSVVGYELLCRSGARENGQFIDGNQASSQVLLNAFHELSIEKVVGKHRAFINFTRDLILAPPPFEPSRLVIEVLETEVADPELLASLSTLKTRGYVIALDDFVLKQDSLPLLEYADIVKLDVLALSQQEIIEHVEYLKKLPVKLLAEKVETYEMLEWCKVLGFELFQGFFLARPKLIHGRKTIENRQAILRLLALLYSEDPSISDAEILITQDPILSYKLLRLVNSAAYGLTRKVNSIRQAITLLGFNIIKNWVNLLVMANVGEKPKELNTAALARAKFCELMAEAVGMPLNRESCFTVGLFSTLDAYLDTPLNELLDKISLEQSLNQALLFREGEKGAILNIAEGYERAEWDKIDWTFLSAKGISASTLSHIYLSSIDWANRTLLHLNE